MDDLCHKSEIRKSDIFLRQGIDGLFRCFARRAASGLGQLARPRAIAFAGAGRRGRLPSKTAVNVLAPLKVPNAVEPIVPWLR